MICLLGFMLVKLIVPCAKAEVAITVHANNSTNFFIFFLSLVSVPEIIKRIIQRY